MKRALFLGVLAVAVLAGSAVSAAVLTIGSGPAVSCYEAARDDRADSYALRECNSAVESDMLTRNDRAATRVNRGIIYINRRNPAAALADFDAAIAMAPDLGEAHINRGAALLLERDYLGAIEAITHGLALNPEEPFKAYFNRGLAHEARGDVRAAYADYRQAQELAPEWQPAQRELARFTVTRR